MISISACSSKNNAQNKTASKNNQQKIEFNTKTITGCSIDNSIFKGKKLTMVNTWGTFCSPCIEEMPEIEELYEELKNQNVNIIGIIIDTPNDKNEQLARSIIQTEGIKYTNIIPDNKLKNSFLTDITAVPTTVFVDGNGYIVGAPVVGSMDKEGYKQKVMQTLQSMKNKVGKN